MSRWPVSGILVGLGTLLLAGSALTGWRTGAWRGTPRPWPSRSSPQPRHRGRAGRLRHGDPIPLRTGRRGPRPEGRPHPRPRRVRHSYVDLDDPTHLQFTLRARHRLRGRRRLSRRPGPLRPPPGRRRAHDPPLPRGHAAGDAQRGVRDRQRRRARRPRPTRAAVAARASPYASKTPGSVCGGWTPAAETSSSAMPSAASACRGTSPPWRRWPTYAACSTRTGCTSPTSSTTVTWPSRGPKQPPCARPSHTSPSSAGPQTSAPPPSTTARGGNLVVLASARLPRPARGPGGAGRPAHGLDDRHRRGPHFLDRRRPTLTDDYAPVDQLLQPYGPPGGGDGARPEPAGPPRAEEPPPPPLPGGRAGTLGGRVGPGDSAAAPQASGGFPGLPTGEGSSPPRVPAVRHGDHPPVNVLAQVCALAAAVNHVTAGVLESFFFHRPAVRRLLTRTDDHSPALRLWTFNVGFTTSSSPAGSSPDSSPTGPATPTTGRALVLVCRFLHGRCRCRSPGLRPAPLRGCAGPGLPAARRRGGAPRVRPGRPWRAAARWSGTVPVRSLTLTVLGTASPHPLPGRP